VTWSEQNKQKERRKKRKKRKRMKRRRKEKRKGKKRKERKRKNKKQEKEKKGGRRKKDKEEETKRREGGGEHREKDELAVISFSPSFLTSVLHLLRTCAPPLGSSLPPSLVFSPSRSNPKIQEEIVSENTQGNLQEDQSRCLPDDNDWRSTKKHLKSF
jgi:hypothetical protein